MFGFKDYTLLDLLRDSQWTTPTWTVREEKIINAIDEMSIIPDTEHGPMLEIATKNQQGVTIYKRRLNLEAVDGEIGKLIRMRDLMEPMRKKQTDTGTNDIS